MSNQGRVMANIFIHGLGQTSASWERTIHGLEVSKDIYCPDLSTILGSGEISYSQLYSGFSAYCGKIGEKVNLCGLSLGGVLALHYAVENPKKVNSLILIGTQYRMPKKLLAFQNKIFKLMPEKMFKEMGFGKEGVIALSQSMMDMDFTSELKNIPCPVLLLCGKKDRTNRKAAVSMSKELVNRKLVYIENAGHEANTDNPERLAELINGFWQFHA